MVEVFGHSSHAGKAMEVKRFGAKMMRIDVPKLIMEPIVEGQPLSYAVESSVTHFYGGRSIFSYTLTDETNVMRINRRLAPPPHRYLPPPHRDEDDFGGDRYDD
ncbi:hypothetical protein FJ930_27590 [Mesorhizobium sp. B2-4-15]|nr:hypothetical protein FJ930_27590 [Mesorhizobium sp. B2-4-15]